MVIVIKLGGRMTASPHLDSISTDIASMKGKESFVIVHGGGDVVTSYAAKMNIQQQFVVSPSGVRSRFTDDDTLEVCVMVLGGLVNTQIVRTLSKNGVEAVGLNGADCNLVRVERRDKLMIVKDGKKIVIDGGHSGKPSNINTDFLNNLLRIGVTPVIAPLGIDESTQMANMDGDSAASAIASALKADALLFITDVEGMLDEGKVVKHIDLPNLELYASKAGFGMNRKLKAASSALKKGVTKVIISSGKIENPIRRALSGEVGTVINGV